MTSKRTARKLQAAAPDWRPDFLRELARTHDVALAATKAGVELVVAAAARADPLAEVIDEDAAAFTRAWDKALAGLPVAA